MKATKTDVFIEKAAHLAGEIVEREFVSPEMLRQYRRVCKIAQIDWIEQLDFMREFLGNHKDGE